MAHALAKSARSNTSVAILGRGQRAGLGTAYSTQHPLHLLNAPAGRMSADADDPDQFARWLSARGHSLARWQDQFVARRLYGEYLGHLADEVGATSHGRIALETIRTEVGGVARNGAGSIVSHTGGTLAARIVVLATGTDKPAAIAQSFGEDVAPFVVDDPWGNFEIGPGESVLMLGAGLTAIDALLTLVSRGHRGRVTLVSRHGLLPHVHVRGDVCESLQSPYPPTARQLARAIRTCVGAQASDGRRQGFMEAMRSCWQDVWQSLPREEKRRCLRHGATLWNVNRHRMAPGVGARVLPLIGDTVTVLAGRLLRISLSDARTLHVDVSRRNGEIRLAVNRVINCTGPNPDPEKTRDRFIRTIVESRLGRSNSLGVGLDVDDANRLIARDGTAQRTAFAMGALTKGHWWEITAMPEIGRQAAGIATNILRELAGSGDPSGSTKRL